METKLFILHEAFSVNGKREEKQSQVIVYIHPEKITVVNDENKEFREENEVISQWTRNTDGTKMTMFEEVMLLALLNHGEIQR